MKANGHRHDRQRTNHPWLTLEPALRTVARELLCNQVDRSSSEEKHFREVDLSLHRTATAILRRFGFQNTADEARDIAQQWYVAMLGKGLKCYQSDRPLYCFAYRILVNLCLTRVRCLRRRHRALSFDVADPSQAPEATVLLSEVQSGVQQALCMLPMLERNAVLLKYWHGLPSDEIAERLGVTAAAVNRLTFKARAKLHTLLSVTSGREHSVAPNGQWMSQGTDPFKVPA